MLRKGIALMAALVVLSALLPARAGGAGDLNEYAICSFSRSFPVYTGPGEEYFRVDGNAKYGSGSCRVWGVTGNWLLVGFLVKSGKYRVGYISADALEYAQNVSGKPGRALSFIYEEAAVVRTGAPLTDDPVLNNERFCYMQGGQRVTVLGYYGNWAYVETDITTAQRGRGFVRKFNLNFTRTAAPTAVPAPKATPDFTVAATPVPTVGSWAPPAAGSEGTFSTWVPQATIRPGGTYGAEVWAGEESDEIFDAYEGYLPAGALGNAVSSGSSLLSSLSHNCPNTGEMLPEAFDPGVTTYLLAVASWVNRVRFTPTAADREATITVNGEVVPSGAASSYITMTNEPRRVEIVVWGTGGAQTVYTVFLQRKPSEKVTEVAVGYIRALYRSEGDWVMNLDRVETAPLGDGYPNGSRSSVTALCPEEERFSVDPHCDLWYGTAENALHADDVIAFAAGYNAAQLYYVVCIEDMIVAVMPYGQD